MPPFARTLVAVLLAPLLVLILSAFTSRSAVNSAILTPTPHPSTLIFDAQPGPDVPTLHAMSAGLTDDAAIVAAAVAYFDANADRLRILWREDHPDRLKAIYAMVLVHLSTPYGVVPTFPSSLSAYLAEPYAHCGTYTWAQLAIARGLGLTMRTVEFVGEHAWLEVQIDGVWELFDATTNIWIDQGIEVLLHGEARHYRAFYTPLLDSTRPDARLHVAEGYDMQRLRMRMPTIGIGYFPPGEMRVGIQ
ncbi:MAG: hypothetical protein SGJ24_16700 [Chloroflexota bacterium]|nr:hypothetical protein [Chloroflexota bacterium]